MSEKNVEVVRRAFEALEQHGVDGMLEFCSPEIEYRVRRDLPDARTYHGHDGVRALAADWQRVFEDFRLGPQELIDAGDSVVGMMRISGRGTTSGIETGNRPPGERADRQYVGALRPAEEPAASAHARTR